MQRYDLFYWLYSFQACDYGFMYLWLILNRTRTLSSAFCELVHCLCWLSLFLSASKCKEGYFFPISVMAAWCKFCGWLENCSRRMISRIFSLPLAPVIAVKIDETSLLFCKAKKLLNSSMVRLLSFGSLKIFITTEINAYFFYQTYHVRVQKSSSFS